MPDRCDPAVQSLLVRCLACLLIATVVNADGRVFVLELRNSSGLQGFRDAEQACASHRARLASAEELRHSVMECFFSSCSPGWLHGGSVGTVACDTVGSALRAVAVRTRNATDDANLDAFCIQDNDMPCGDPPSFPNVRLQGHTGFEMGDELLYTCVPGYVMPSGQGTFSLLCDSCGEWYGLVQMCVQDGSEVHVDYEDRFTDPHESTEDLEEKSEYTRERMYGAMDGAAHWKGKMSQEQQATGFGVVAEERHGQQEVRGEVMDFEEATEGRGKDAQDFPGHQTWQQESREVVRTDAPAATEAPVSLLSQKHMFWFPSEAFQEEGLPVSTNPGAQNTQRASGAQSEESKEQESHERQQPPVDGDDRDRYDDHDADDQDDHTDSRHDQDDHDSRQDEDDHDDHVKHYTPARHDDLNSRERDDQDDIDVKHESHEDHGDITDDHDEDDDDTVHRHVSEEHPDHDDDLDETENDRDNDHDEHDSYDDLDSHEYDDDGHRRVIFSVATDHGRNVTQKKADVKATTDETWLDGYPVVPQETGRDDSASPRLRPDHRQKGSALRSTDRPNEVERRKPDPFASSPEKPESPTAESELARGMEEVWGSFIPTAAASPDQLQPSDPDVLDYDTQQATPTDSWLGDLTELPFLNHDPAPPVHNNNNILAGVAEEHTMHNLPGEAGERGEMEGERGETSCAGGTCPPRTYGRGPKVAAIIVAVLAVATAIFVGVWCYRRQLQKSSVYEMNGKSQSQTRPGQQMEMQQKV